MIPVSSKSSFTCKKEDHLSSKSAQIEQYCVFEVAQQTEVTGNPFVDVSLTGQFTQGDVTVKVYGFYDGGGTFRLRFMPHLIGEWQYVTQSNLVELDGLYGTFVCIEASTGNHGPVQVTDTHHFDYADGTRHLSFGTTCYAWIHQPEARQLQTLETLRESPFNKLRMCIFPKYYEYNRDDPARFPFERAEDETWDLERFNPEFFQHLERRISELRDMGIEADIILFHPYDNGRWGFDQIGAEADDHYLRYIVSRLAAYRNVWWSLANEWDLCVHKTVEDWDRLFQIVQEYDLYGHLRSIHNWHTHYDHSKSWVTHASIQTLVAYPDLEMVADWREQYQKPIVVDETCYEGNTPFRWGFITAQEMVHRFWLGIVLGGYVGHGETYLHPDDVLWWSKGGVLHGESPDRIAFLRNILEAIPAGGLRPTTEITRDLQCAGIPGMYYLAYGGRGQPAEARLNLPENERYHVDIVDAWAMTITPLESILSGTCHVALPGKPYSALRLHRLKP